MKTQSEDITPQNAKSLDQEIRDLHDLFGHLTLRYAWLANTFALLNPLVTDKRLEDQLFKSNRLLATSPVTRALFHTCVVDICTLVLDNDQKKINPSLKRLVRPFLRKRREKNLLERLATVHAKKVTRQGLFRSSIENWADSLTDDWSQLNKALPRFESLRHRLIAHQEVIWDEATRSYRPPEMSTLKDLYPELEDIVQIITQLMVHLTRILMGGEMKRKKFERQLRENAEVFWNLKDLQHAPTPKTGVARAR